MKPLKERSEDVYGFEIGSLDELYPGAILDRRTHPIIHKVFVHDGDCPGSCQWDCGGEFFDAIIDAVRTALDVE